MRTYNQQQRPPCKHGVNCRFLPTNKCHYYHPPQELAMRGRMNYNNNQYKQQFQQQGRSSSKGKRQNYNQPSYQAYMFEQQPQMMKQSSPFFQQKNKEDHCKQLCKNFHMGSCNMGDKCERLHQFLYKDAQNMRRLQHLRQIPQEAVAKLTKIPVEGRQLFALRQGSKVSVFEYIFEDGQLKTVDLTINLPERCEYYQQKNNYFYYSAENETTKYTDMGFCNIFTQKVTWIANSHTAKITGMVHWEEQQILITSSIAGDIKIWTKQSQGEEQKYIFSKQISQKFQRGYNPNASKLEILFVDILTLDGTKFIAAGTDDGRLLFWSGLNLDFSQFFVGARYAKVYKVKLISLEKVPTAVVLAWSSDSTISAVILINLQNCNVNLVREVLTEGQVSRNFHLLEYTEDFLFVGSIRGEVSVYNLRQSEKRIGAIFHRNTVSDVICSPVEMKNTGVKIKLIYILEKRNKDAEGSFSIYLLQ